MYLLNTVTQKLQEFGGPEQVRYAILSHRWTEEEITFEDIKDLSSCSKSGVPKVISFCKVALELGYDWCWIDTCCINKASSAELSEAINSMFSWYQHARTCVIYLQDVTSEIDSKPFEDEFRASTWFLRSWTLQELLASAKNNTLFYNVTWQLLGSRRSLSALVSDITTIDEAALLGDKPLSKYCIAERMSWASMRSATRIEDVAYSLLGIFDIQMPLVYGEGLKAFRRLQQAIMVTSDDETIFVWEPAKQEDTRLLAPSPSAFTNSRRLKYYKPSSTGRRGTYELMSRGVRFDSAQHIRAGTVATVLLLNVVQQELDKSKYLLGIYLRSNQNQQGYRRVWVTKDEQLWRGEFRRDIGSRDPALELETKYEVGDGCFFLPFDHDEPVVITCEQLSFTTKVQPKILYGFDLSYVPAPMLQLANAGRFLSDSESGPVCNILFDPPFHGVSVIHLGVNGSLGKPVCAMLSDIGNLSQADPASDQLDHSIRNLTVDYSTVDSVVRTLLPDRINDNKDWYIQVWPPQAEAEAETSWYLSNLWQHPKQQPDLNYFCPFPFHPENEGSSRRPITSYTGWGFELLSTGPGKWKFGMVRYSIVSNWSAKLSERLVSKILASKPRSLTDCKYSIDLDTFKRAPKFPA